LPTIIAYFGTEKYQLPLIRNNFPAAFQADDEGLIPSPAPIDEHADWTNLIGKSRYGKRRNFPFSFKGAYLPALFRNLLIWFKSLTTLDRTIQLHV
jgi:hypothetical protein